MEQLNRRHRNEPSEVECSQLAHETPVGILSPMSTLSTVQKEKNYDEEKEQRKIMFTSIVHTLQRSRERLTATDECDTFGSMMAHAVHQIPPGPDRQLAVLHAHQAVVKINLARHGAEVALDVTDKQ